MFSEIIYFNAIYHIDSSVSAAVNESNHVTRNKDVFRCSLKQTPLDFFVRVSKCPTAIMLVN